MKKLTYTRCDEFIDYNDANCIFSSVSFAITVLARKFKTVQRRDEFVLFPFIYSCVIPPVALCCPKAGQLKLRPL